MPLEVNELGIFMKVMEKDYEKKQNSVGEDDCENCKGFSKDEVVADCVARILEILERKNRR
jgi:hypothetical protein